MDKFLSELIKHQSASVVIRPYRYHDDSVALEGELSIVVKGDIHTFTVQRATVEAVAVALEYKYLHHDWSKANTPLAIIAIHNSVADVVDVDGCQVIIASYDVLANNGCPVCSQDLGDTGREDRTCPGCGFVWEESDE